MIEQPPAGWQIEGATTHPGAVLREDFLAPFQMSLETLAVRTGLDPKYLGALLDEREDITPDAAMRVARFFGTTAEFWLNLQTGFALSSLRAAQGEAISTEVRPLREVAA